jgi:hypothetical protein
MRIKLSSANNKSTKPTPAPRKTLANFPLLGKSTSTNQNDRSTNMIQWSKIATLNTRPTKPTEASKSSGKFNPEEIGPIMKDLLSGLSVCRSKEEQLIVMFEVATKWIYNNVP